MQDGIGIWLLGDGSHSLLNHLTVPALFVIVFKLNFFYVYGFFNECLCTGTCSAYRGQKRVLGPPEPAFRWF